MKIWHPYTQEATDLPPIEIDRGEGAYVYTAEGRRLLDAISSWWVNLHGHAHPLIAEAIAAQARKLEQVIFAGFTHKPAEELAVALGRILPEQLTRVFYSDNGSTAVESAIKIGVQFWHNLGRKQKCRIVALERAYHGDTIGAMSISADSTFTASFDALRLPVLRVKDDRELDLLLRQRKDEIAVMIVEPLIHGAAGMVTYPAEQLRRFSELCSANDVLFIVDEVFTGFGRTGRMFACDHASVVPDIMCLSKGLTGGFLPLAATVCRERIYEAFSSSDRSRAFFHGHSYSGNPLGCAAALASLKIFETEPVFERIAAIERVHRERLPEFSNHESVCEVRMLGTIAAIELRASDAGYLSDIRNRLYPYFLNQGILLRPLGNVIYTVPPYIISAGEMHSVYDVIRTAL